jgi:hypothetical protein
MARSQNATFFVFTFVLRLVATLYIVIALMCITQDRDASTPMDSPLLAGILSADIPLDPSAPTVTTLPPSTSIAEPAVASSSGELRLQAIARMNEDVMVDSIQWKVVGVEELGNFLKSNNQFQADATTLGKFVRVIMEVKNCKKQPAIYTPPHLLDAQGRRYPSFDEGAVYVGAYGLAEEMCAETSFNPDVARKCVDIFEVAAHAAD